MTIGRERDTSATLAAVPDSLLIPLIDAAGEILRAANDDEVPSAARALRVFDRRGLASATARQQLRRVLDGYDSFRDTVTSVFLERDEVRAALEAWRVDETASIVADAAARDDLALLASALYAARPPGYEFALGFLCAAPQHQLDERARDDDARAQGIRLQAADEARRRAEEARDAARAELARVEAQLREERRARRDREVRASEEAAEATRRAREAEATLARVRSDAERAESRATREAERARDAERKLRALRREVTTNTAPAPEHVGIDAARVDEALRRARDVVACLEELARNPVRPASGTAPALTSTVTSTKRRRPTVPCPPGLHADTAEGLDAMLRTRGVVLVVDGYNVSMVGWPESDVAGQRNALVGALSRLHLRVRCDVVVVFDGSDVEGVRPPRRPGVRVVFSEPDEAADPVIVREVAALPPTVPVLVASSDRWVGEHVAAEGATPVPAAALVTLLRR